MTREAVSVKISGMTCAACATRIEKSLLKLGGVQSCTVSLEQDTATLHYDPQQVSQADIHSAIRAAGYDIQAPASPVALAGIAVIFLIILALGSLSDGLALTQQLSGAVTLPLLFLAGLFTSLHCVGMCGGIMLSQTIVPSGNAHSAVRPSLAYNLGRILSYTLIGAAVGALGSVLSVTIAAKAAITLAAALFMILMGLSQSGISSFRVRLPMPSLGRFAPKTPLTVGLLNGLMPCGPLQTMQLYALSTGSAFDGAIAMFVFALGTSPLMFSLGAAAGLVSRGYTRLIARAGGVLVIALGLIMASRGLALSGFIADITPPPPAPPAAVTAQTEKPVASLPQTGKAELKDGIQVVRSTAVAAGYFPPVIYIQKNVPVRWIIQVRQLTSCNNEIVIPAYNIAQKLNANEVTIEFTPGSKDIRYGCWMGMLTGSFKVVDKLE